MEATKDKKIIVLGAGLGGLLAAYRLGQAGFDVTVYEKKPKSTLGYPWHDSVKPDTFSDVKLQVPKEALIKKCSNYSIEKSVTFTLKAIG